MSPYVCIQKAVGQTPLQALEDYRATRPDLSGVPMAYAGRLDPMASGTLLILIGDECKKQSNYHSLDKTYRFSILFGVSSDTQDILGRLSWSKTPPKIQKRQLQKVLNILPGTLSLPYPHFSSKTVQGKPLHVWTLENRLDEITIPTQSSRIYTCSLQSIHTYSTEEIYSNATERINSLPTVTDPRKALGADFRRADVLADWQNLKTEHKGHTFSVATIDCTASSGTYMRSLAEYIASRLDTQGLAFSIHRTTIGRYVPLYKQFGIWTKRFR